MKRSPTGLRRRSLPALVAAWALLPAPFPAYAQTPASPAPQALPATPESASAAPAAITGLITDVNGGIVPGATIVVLDGTGAVQTSTTADAEGAFCLLDLPPGRTQLRISAAGLQTFQPAPVDLRPGELFKLPDTALPIATVAQSIDVVVTRTQIADEEIHAQTQQRVLGILPNFYTSYVWDAAPLNTHQKFYLALRASTDPWVFLRTGITAGIQQANGTFPYYGGGPAGYLQRYGAAYGDAVVGRVIGSALLPAVFHQDPRYFYRGTGGTPRRTVHALFSAVVARSDGGRIEPNYTRTLGDFTTGYLSRTWHPGSDNGVGLALGNMLYGIADAAGHNLAQEFLFKHISRGTPRFARGKPPEEHETSLHP